MTTVPAPEQRPERAPEHPPEHPRVGLFVTCLVDLFRPSVGFAAVKLLEEAGCRVVVPEGQTCCGQPAYNSGDRRDARDVARTVLRAFRDVDYIVAPSGSCTGMLHEHYPVIFAGEPEAEEARALAGKTWELMAFLTDVMGLERVAASWPGTATYHDSCSGLRELGIKQQPRRLLQSVEGLELREMAEAEVCCGFGGTFCVKYPEISDSIVTKKAENIERSGAKLLLAGDLGCLMNMAGKLQRRGAAVEVRHVAEVLAGQTDEPAIGEPARPQRPAAE
ncbi:(Fe-S)-binding protein [Aquibaculum arenosum]|uniref:(Fe-S)-binding protein n=1 Tax=Aquibaculum arenosum TaxID=3032591 RepID=A0ABT5YQ51_9PROT|nr:(Fe-S)-binding protein [Fodinicurvata sp. CAU 1616]MDF2097096.1 (Fe-S)-binding protein [Fodinicurvata sp. CAU 1616]